MIFFTESVSSIDGSRNRKRKKKKKPKYQVGGSNANDDYKSSEFSELSTQASTERLQHNSFKDTLEPCTNGEDKNVLKNGGLPFLPKPQRDQHPARSAAANSVPCKAELSVSKEVSVINGTT